MSARNDRRLAVGDDRTTDAERHLEAARRAVDAVVAEAIAQLNVRLSLGPQVAVPPLAAEDEALHRAAQAAHDAVEALARIVAPTRRRDAAGPAASPRIRHEAQRLSMRLALAEDALLPAVRAPAIARDDHARIAGLLEHGGLTGDAALRLLPYAPVRPPARRDADLDGLQRSAQVHTSTFWFCLRLAVDELIGLVLDRRASSPDRLEALVADAATTLGLLSGDLDRARSLGAALRAAGETPPICLVALERVLPREGATCSQALDLLRETLLPFASTVEWTDEAWAGWAAALTAFERRLGWVLPAAGRPGSGVGR